MTTWHDCPWCSGSGHTECTTVWCTEEGHGAPCPYCFGRGVVIAFWRPETERWLIRVPVAMVPRRKVGNDDRHRSQA